MTNLLKCYLQLFNFRSWHPEPDTESPSIKNFTGSLAKDASKNKKLKGFDCYL